MDCGRPTVLHWFTLVGTRKRKLVYKTHHVFARSHTTHAHSRVASRNGKPSLITATCDGSPPKYTWDNFTCDETPVQAPNLLKAAFTKSARQIRVKLEAAASQWTFKGLFSCSTLFHVNTGAASCEWLGGDELMMTLHEGALGHPSAINGSAGGSAAGANGCFRPGASLQLKTGVLESSTLSGSTAT